MAGPKWIAPALLLALASGAQAGMRFGVAGVGNFSGVVQSPTPASGSRELGLGGGLFAELAFGKSVGLEVGAFYVQRKFQGTAGLVAVDRAFPFIQVPLQVRFRLGTAFSVGVGGFYSVGAGNGTVTVAGASVSRSLAEAGFKSSDYGLVGSAGIGIPVGKSAAILVEGRYLHGLSEIMSSPSAGVSSKWSDMQALVGVRFGGSK